MTPPPPPSGPSRSERAYRVLLRLYPRSFRERYGDDALETFRDRCREARLRDGSAGLARVWARTLPNVLLHGLLERAHEARRWEAGRATGALVAAAARGLARSPGPSAGVVLTLAVGIGASVALFSVFRGVLLRPLPFPEGDRLVRLWERSPEGARVGPSPWNFADWDGSVPGLGSMAAWYLTSGTFRTEDGAEEVRIAQVTADFFRVLGVRPRLGDDLRRQPGQRYGPLVLSHGLWTRLYGADPAVVGRTVEVGGEAYEVAGVTAEGFAFPAADVEAWLAWDLPTVYADNPQARTWRFLDAAARLEPGASAARAEEALDARARALAERHPDANRGWGAALTSLRDEIVGDARATLWTALGAVLLILATACADVANLLVARAPARSREMALRTTLGASRSRIVAHLIVESLLLAGAAGLLGLALGAVLLDLLVSFDAGRIPRLAEVRIDPGVLAFTVVVSAATALLFGVVPAVQTLRDAAPRSLVEGGRATGARGQHRLREGFVATQVALALVLLTGAGLFRASLEQLGAVDPGFEPAGVATFRVSLDGAQGGEGAVARYYDGLLERVEALPGVVRAGAAQALPLDPVGNDFRRPYRPAGSALDAADAPAVQMRIVTPGYRATLGTKLLEGSDLSGTEEPGEPLVALVNRTLARRLWPDGGAVDGVLEVDFREGWQPYRVVGVVDDVRHYGLRESPRPELFLSHRQVPYLAMSVVVRTTGEPAGLQETLRRAVLAHPPGQPAHHFVGLDDLVGRTVAEERFLLVLLGVFSAIALVLAASGVYGVVACAVGERRREIGVRMALGARPAGVVAEVMRGAAAMAGVGLVAGALLIRASGGVLDGVLYGVRAGDPATVASGAAFLALVTGLAAWLPARRAARVAPIVALRAD